MFLQIMSTLVKNDEKWQWFYQTRLFFSVWGDQIWYFWLGTNMGANHTRPQYARKVAIFGLFWHFWAFDATSQVFFTPVDGLYDWILSFSIQYVCKDDVGTSFLKINFFPYSPPNGPLCTVGHFKGVGGEFVKIKAKCTCWCIFNQILKHLLRDKVFLDQN